MTTLLRRGLRWPSPQACLIALSVAVLAWPTLQMLATSVWTSDEQSHGPLVIAASLLLLAGSRHTLASLPSPRSRWPGWAVLACALPLLAFARSQGFATVEVAALILAGCSILIAFKGRAGLSECAFALGFLLFAVPWPETLVVALTQPLKSAVSAVSEALLHAAGYAVGRAGVMLAVGPYEVLVADACAGLNSMFVLEAITVLYIRLFGGDDRVCSIGLAVLAVPIAFLANVLRVIVLVLLLVYLGDEAARGFVHGFAGVLLMSVALVLTFAAHALMRALRRRWRATQGPVAA